MKKSNNSKNKIRNTITLAKEAYGEYKLQIILLTIFGFFSGIFEGIGINAIIPLLSQATEDSSGETNLITEKLADFFALLHIDFSVKYILIFIILLFILKAITVIILGYMTARIAAGYEEKIRSRLLKTILDANWSHLIKQKLGHLETILMVDAREASSLLRALSTGIITITGLLIYLIVAINISLIVTLVTMVLGLTLFFSFYPLIRKMRKIGHSITVINKDISHIASENVLGIKTVKSMAVSNKVLINAEKYFYRLKKLTIKTKIIKNITTSLIQPIGIIFIALVFAFSYKTTSFGIGSLAAIIYLIYRIFTYIQQLQNEFLTINARVPFLKSVLDYEKESNYSAEKNEGSKEFEFKKEIEVKGVNFKYNKDGDDVLKNIDFTLKKGEMTGLIGPSGVGKTTLVDLILRLLEPTDGEILLDGISVKDIDLDSWRKSIGYVSQDIFLINDTIENNISFYDNFISESKIKESAKMANIDEFIESLPNKYKTIVGERGMRLSAGQRQRIVIARVLAKNPQLLLLDEATSALDNESEVQIQKVINNLKGKVTVLVIAHRLSTVKESDSLLILEDGKIKNEGSPEDSLKDKDSYFFKMYNIRK